MSEENHRYSVLIVGISGIAGGPVMAVERLTEKFRLPREVAEQLVAAIPAVVKKDVEHAEAELYATALREIGAEARMVRFNAPVEAVAAGAGIVTPRRASSTSSVAREAARTSGAYSEIRRQPSLSGDSARRPMHIVRSATGSQDATVDEPIQKTVMGSPESMGFRLPAAPADPPRPMETSQDAEDTIMMRSDALAGLPSPEAIAQMIADGDGPDGAAAEAPAVSEEQALVDQTPEPASFDADVAFEPAEFEADTASESASFGVVSFDADSEFEPASFDADAGVEAVPPASPEAAASSSLESAGWSVPPVADVDADAESDPRIALPSSEETPPSGSFDLQAFALPDGIRSGSQQAAPAGGMEDELADSAAAFFEQAAGELAETTAQNGPNADLLKRLSGDFGIAEEDVGPPPPATDGFPSSGAFDVARPSAFDELMAMGDSSSHLPGIDASMSRLAAGEAPTRQQVRRPPSPFAPPASAARPSPFGASPATPPAERPRSAFSDPTEERPAFTGPPVAGAADGASMLDRTVEGFGVLPLRDSRNESGLNLQLDTKKPHLTGPQTAIGDGPRWQAEPRRPSSELELAPTGVDIDPSVEPRHPARRTTPGGQQAVRGTVGVPESARAPAGLSLDGVASGASRKTRAPRPKRAAASAPVIGGFTATHERNRRGTQRVVRVLLTLMVVIIAVSGLLAAGMLYLRHAAAQDATRFAQGSEYVEHILLVEGRASADAAAESADAIRACAGDGVAPDLVCRYSREWYTAHFGTVSDAVADRAPGTCFGHLTEDGTSSVEELDCTLTSAAGEPLRLARLATRRCDASLLELPVGGSTACRFGEVAQLLPKDAEFMTSVDSTERLTLEFRRELELSTDVGPLATREYLVSDESGPREYHYYAASLGTFVRQAPLAGAANLRVTYTERDGRGSGVQVWPR